MYCPTRLPMVPCSSRGIGCSIDMAAGNGESVAFTQRQPGNSFNLDNALDDFGTMIQPNDQR